MDTPVLIYLIICAVVELIFLIPLISASVRRLHDIGRSGFWILLELVPFGILVLFYMWFLDSQPGTNEYGESPKDIKPLNEPIMNNEGFRVIQPGVYPNQNIGMFPNYVQPIYNEQGNVDIQPNLYEAPGQVGVPINNPALEPQVQQNVVQINPTEEQQYGNPIPNAVTINDNMFDKPDSGYNIPPPNDQNN